MSVSQNGWPAGYAANIATYTVPGTTVQLPINRTAAPLLLHVAARYDQHVQRLHPGWCWGYAFRDIRGSSALSNHASGTAIDLNAPLHPLGSNPGSNYSSVQIAAIHAIVADLHGTIGWGGDYDGRKDGMHFEVTAGRDAVLAEIARIGHVTSVPPFPGILHVGMNGSDVQRLQKRLVALGVHMDIDSVYGPVTVAAVTHFQMTHHLGQDGIVGPATWNALWT